MEGQKFIQPTKTKDGTANHQDNPLDSSTRSSSSSGVGIASTYLQNQISLRRSLNDWDDGDPLFVARRDSFEKRMDEENEEEEERLAFCPSKMEGRRLSSSNPEMTNLTYATSAMNNGGSTSYSAPDDLGYIRSSFDSSEHALTMDESLRSGGAALDDASSSGEHIGDVNNEGELLKMMLSANDNNFMNRDDLSSEDSSSSSSSEEDLGVSQESGLDCVYRMGKPIELMEPVNFGSQTSLDSVHSSDHSGHYSNEGDQTMKTTKKDGDIKLNGEQTAAAATTAKTAAIPSPNSEDSPSSMDAINPLDVSHHTIPLTDKITERTRTLSTVSLISLLKIQDIPEHGAFKDNINIEEVAVEETARNSDDENSVISELGDSQREGDQGVALLDVHGDNEDDQDSTDEDVVRIDIMPMKGDSKPPENGLDLSELSDECKEKMQINNKSQGSFIPLPQRPMQEQQVIQNLPPERRNSSLKSQGNSPTEGEESSTYFLRSLKSTGQVTHMSDAPDFDYDSMTSSDEAADTTRGKTSTTQQNLPNERRSSSIERQEKRVSDKVCGLLGLPKDEGARRLNRGIMSKDTELQLRNLLKREQNIDSGTNENNKQKPVSSPDSDTSDDSSKMKAREDQKWEDIRQRRLLKRQSSKTITTAHVENENSLSTSLPVMKQDEGTNNNNTLNFNETESDDSSLEDLNMISQWGKRHSTAATAESLSFVRNKDVPKRGLPPKSSCPIQQVEKDDDGSVFTNFGRSFRNIMLGNANRDSTNSDPSERNGNRDSKSSCSSRRDSRLAAFLGWHQPAQEVSDKNESFDDESSDDEDTGFGDNILSEGEYYLAMSMLVYMYALLRETAMLGHTDISFDEVDVNSFQSVLSDSDAEGILSKTKSAGFIIRVVLDELEKKDAFETVSDMSVLKEFKNWVQESRCKQLDVATETTIKELRRKVARTRWKRAITAVKITIRLKKSSSRIVLDQDKLRSDPELRHRKKRVSSLGARNRGAFSQSMMWVSSAKSQIMNSLGVSDVNIKDGQSTSNTRSNTLVGSDEIKQIIDDALEQPRFFRKGSLMSNLIDSGIEVVWFGDRHPNDVVYSICCNRRQKRVSVVFRGTVNSHNWLMNMKFSMAEHVNPITEDYYGRSSNFGLHTGFSLYLSRQRKDSSNTKIEEIFSMINEIGRAIAPDGNYELSITGHSLGGALATLLSFYAATSSTFDNLKTIRVFTFAAPRVGCQRFLYAYQYLEQIGKIRLARFSNTQDIVPLIPFVDQFKIGRPYMHVGMHVRLHGTSNWAQYWLRNALDVTYPKHQDIISHIKRGFLNNVFTNLNTLKGFVKNHTLSEYQRRIHFALEYRNALAKTSFKYDKRRNRVKTLEEYYFIRGATMVTCTKDLTRVNLEARETEKHNRQTRKIIIALIAVALVEGAVLMRVLGKQSSCESVPSLVYPLLFLLCDHGYPTSTSPALHIPQPLQMSDELPESSFKVASIGSIKASNDIKKSSQVKSDAEMPIKEEENSDDRGTIDGSLFHFHEYSKTKVERKRQLGVNMLRQTNMIWGNRRRSHYNLPSNIVQQRMHLRSSSFSSITDIHPFNGNPDIVQKATALLLEHRQ